jgi:hypothetical protein
VHILRRHSKYAAQAERLRDVAARFREAPPPSQAPSAPVRRRRLRHVLSDHDRHDIAQARLDGDTTASLAKKYEVSEHSIRTVLAAAGVTPPPVSLTASQVDMIQRMHSAGQSATSIARSLGVPESTARFAIVRPRSNNVSTRPPLAASAYRVGDDPSAIIRSQIDQIRRDNPIA